MGLLNTIMVSVVGIFLATILGLIVGVARLSSNWLVSKVALTYVEIFRNTPVLVQLLVIYFVVFLQMPAVKDSIRFPLDMYLSQRGFYLPRPEVAARRRHLVRGRDHGGRGLRRAVVVRRPARG